MAQQDHAKWLAVLEDVGQPAALREEALKQIATAIIQKDIELAALRLDLEESENRVTRGVVLVNSITAALARFTGARPGAEPVELTLVRGVDRG